MHRSRWYRYGSTELPERVHGFCVVDGCDRPMKSNGVCGTHYWRLRRGKDLLAPVRIHVRGTLEERLWAQIDKTESCWNWTGKQVSADGYGRIALGGRGSKRVAAHRVAYEFLVGPIPDGLEMDHLCRNRACCNPAHLEPVTLQENQRRRVAAMTHCKWGHSLEDAMSPPSLRGGRRCRVCAYAHTNRRRPQRRAEARAAKAAAEAAAACPDELEESA